MKKSNYISLRWKIGAFILIGTFLFSLIILTITYRYVNKILTESLIEQGRIVAANISELAAEKLIEDDIVSLKSIIEKYKYYSNIQYILIEDFNNQIKTDTYNGDVPREIVEGHVFKEADDNKSYQVQKITIASENTRVYDILEPIKEGLLGFVRVGMRQSYVENHLKSTILFLGIVFLGGTFLAIILAIFIVTLQITRPISYLTDMAYKISMGDFNSPVRVAVKNEIGILSEAIERMRESLKTSIERLRKH